MSKLSLVCLLLIPSVAICCTDTVNLEAEDASSTNGQRMHRSNASGRSGGLTILLLQGEYIEYRFHAITSSDSVCDLSIDDVAYSNDGNFTDTVRISVDNNILIGEFQTKAKRGNGFLWNEFRHSGRVGNQAVNVSTGYRHTLTLEAVSTDENGVELDTVKVTFTDCRTGTSPAEKCPKFEITINSNDSGGTNTTDVDSSNDSGGGPGTLQIVGIVMGAVSLLIGIIGVPSVIYKCKLKRSKSNQGCGRSLDLALTPNYSICSYSGHRGTDQEAKATLIRTI